MQSPAAPLLPRPKRHRRVSAVASSFRCWRCVWRCRRSGLASRAASPMGGAGVSAGQGIAPVIDDKSGAQATNIASLTEVIKATPKIRTPTTPAARPMPGSGASPTRSRTSRRRSRSTPTMPRPTPTARWRCARPAATIRRWSTSTAPSRRIRTTARPISAAPISCARRATSTRRFADLSQAIRLSPESAQGYHARGLIYQRQGQHPQAINDFDAAIDRDPFAAAPYLARGQSLIASASTIRRSRISTPPSTSTTATPTPGPGSASPTRRRAIAPRRSNPTSAQWHRPQQRGSPCRHVPARRGKAEHLLSLL